MKRVKWSQAETPQELESFYSAWLPTIREVAKKSGYAIGVHGSMKRDLDLIAVPWVNRFVKPNTLASRIQMAVCGLKEVRPKREKKPHGRIGYALHVGYKAYIDLSVIQPSVSPKSN